MRLAWIGARRLDGLPANKFKFIRINLNLYGKFIRITDWRAARGWAAVSLAISGAQCLALRCAAHCLTPPPRASLSHTARLPAVWQPGSLAAWVSMGRIWGIQAALAACCLAAWQPGSCLGLHMSHGGAGSAHDQEQGRPMTRSRVGP